MEKSGSQLLIEALQKMGTDIIFGYPGGAIMPVYDALYDVQDSLKHVLVRNEQGAAFAAQGYARTTGKTGVCISTSGPGATNLITGIADAILDCVPLVCITGQVVSGLLGKDAFQEADIIGITVPVTKWNYQITKAAEIHYVIEKAFKIAKGGKPGPVLIDITKNAQVELVGDFCQLGYTGRELFPPLKIDKSKFEEAANLINQAKKPLLLIGHGISISKAETALLELAEKANIPVVSTLLGLSSFPCDHDLYKGMVGMHGNYGPNTLSNEADVIIAVGMRFDDRVTGDVSRYLTQAKVIHIEIDQAEINKNVKADVALHSDAKEALLALIPLIKESQHQSWHNHFFDKHIEEKTIVHDKEIHPKLGKIKMAEVINMISEKTKGKAIIASDVGQNQMVTARYYKFSQKNSHISSGGLGTMGFSLPAGIGAQLGNPDKLVIAIMGDGGLQMNIQELAVVTQEKIPLKILVLNNSYLGMVRQWQEMFFEKRYSFTKLDNPDFIKIADGYGINAIRIDQREELNGALDNFLNSSEACFLEVVVEMQENVFPMVPTGCSISETRLS